jgi:predicted nucleic acid-binding protein
MTNGQSTWFVDTNILIYANDARFPVLQAASIRLLDALARTGTGTVSVQVLGEFFTVATKKLRDAMSREDAQAVVLGFVRYWDVLAITANVVAEAIEGVNRHQLAYWDALIWATAKLNGIPYVLSEDFSDGQLIENVRFINPLAPGFDLARVVGAN